MRGPRWGQVTEEIKGFCNDFSKILARLNDKGWEPWAASEEAAERGRTIRLANRFKLATVSFG